MNAPALPDAIAIVQQEIERERRLLKIARKQNLPLSSDRAIAAIDALYAVKERLTMAAESTETRNAP